MVGAGFYAKKLTIDHVRHPGNGMPIGSMSIDEAPHQAVGSDPFLDGGILAYVLGIVIQHEILTPHRPIDGECYQDEDQAQERNTEFVTRLSHEFAR
jgi:hypothetical protein